MVIIFVNNFLVLTFNLGRYENTCQQSFFQSVFRIFVLCIQHLFCQFFPLNQKFFCDRDRFSTNGDISGYDRHIISNVTNFIEQYLGTIFSSFHTYPPGIDHTTYAIVYDVFPVN